MHPLPEFVVNLRTMLVSFLLLVLLFGCKPAEQPTVATEPNPIAETATTVFTGDPIELMETEGLLQRISTLSSDEFGGRAPMSEGEKLTLDYLESQFREMGLDPMFGDSYRQPVPLVAIVFWSCISRLLLPSYTKQILQPATQFLFFNFQSRESTSCL